MYLSIPKSERVPVGGRVPPEQGRIARLMARLWAKVACARVRAKGYGVINTLTWTQWRVILENTQGGCHYCGETVGIDNLGIDHVIPMIEGGANSIDNVVAACFVCNASKGVSSYPKRLRA